MLKKIFILTSLFGLFIYQVSAQSDEEKIRTILKDLNKDVEKLIAEGSSRADKIVSYMNPHFVYENKTVNIMNILSKDSYNKKTMEFMLHEMRSSNVTAKRKFIGLIEVHVRNNMALAVYEIEYELYESDRLINKGMQHNQVVLRKNSEGKWLIEYMNAFNLDDITYKSTCICEIYETQGLANIITETIVPDGHEADILEDKFSIDQSTEPRQVRHGFRDYLWELDGAIYVRNPDGSQGRQIGAAKSRQELLITLLKKEVYPDRCANVIRKLK